MEYTSNMNTDATKGATSAGNPANPTWSVPPSRSQTVQKLRHLLDHMRNRRALDEFDFCAIYFHRTPVYRGTCKSAGCMLGEFPHCWPDRFQYGKAAGYDHEIHFRPEAPELEGYKVYAGPFAKCQFRGSAITAAYWLAISIQEAEWIFMPDSNHPDLGANELTIWSPLENVLRRLEDMITYKETGQTRFAPMPPSPDRQ